MSHPDAKEIPAATAKNRSVLWLVFGLPIGCGLGIILGNLALGIGLGMLFGTTVMVFRTNHNDVRVSPLLKIALLVGLIAGLLCALFTVAK